MSTLKRKTPLRAKTPLKTNGSSLRRVPFKNKQSVYVSEAEVKTPPAQRKADKKGNDNAKGGLVERLDAVFSLFIRLRDAMDGGKTRCISCGTVFPFFAMQCGHFFSRRNMSTRFDPLNCHSQCVECNCHKSGNLEEYKKRLIGKIGRDNFDELSELARTERKWSDDELREAIAFYTAEAKRLSRNKGIKVMI